MEKKLAQTVEAVRTQHPEAEVEVWAEDEHRIGLHPVNRRVWSPADEPATAPVNCKYQWLWLAGFVCPTSGETYLWIVPFLTHKVFNPMLAEFARHFELGERKRVVRSARPSLIPQYRQGGGAGGNRSGIFATQIT